MSPSQRPGPVLLAALLALPLGCTAPGGTDAPDKPADDTGATLGPDDLTTAGLDLTLATVQTVVWARWDTATPTRSVVTASFDGGERVVEEAEAGTKHEVRLVGIPALTDVAVRITADGTDASAEGTITTGALPAWVPDLTYAADAPEAAEGGITLAPVILSAGGGVLGIDAAGRTVWSWPPEDAGFPWPPFRAALSLDGGHVVYNHQAPSAANPGTIMRISLDGDDVVNTSVMGAHTDFVEYTPGGYLTLGWDIRDIDGVRLLGDTILERAPDGTERVVWTVWDDFSPDPDQEYPTLYPADPTAHDWSHVNGITYAPDEDAVYVTMTHENAVVRVDRASGTMTWWLSGQGGDFTNTSSGPLMTLPHSVQRTETGVTVFSRENPGDPSACSRVVDIALDEAAWEATQTWEYSSPDCLLVPYLGGAERLDGGNTLVAWTTAGRLDEVTPDGEIAWQVSTSIGAAFGFSGRFPTLGE